MFIIANITYSTSYLLVNYKDAVCASNSNILLC